MILCCTFLYQSVLWIRPKQRALMRVEIVTQCGEKRVLGFIVSNLFTVANHKTRFVFMIRFFNQSYNVHNCLITRYDWLQLSCVFVYIEFTFKSLAFKHVCCTAILHFFCKDKFNRMHIPSFYTSDRYLFQTPRKLTIFWNYHMKIKLNQINSLQYLSFDLSKINILPVMLLYM